MSDDSKYYEEKQSERPVGNEYFIRVPERGEMLCSRTNNDLKETFCRKSTLSVSHVSILK